MKSRAEGDVDSDCGEERDSIRQVRERPPSPATGLQRQPPAHGADPRPGLAPREPPAGRYPRGPLPAPGAPGVAGVAPPYRLRLRVRVRASSRRTDSADEVAAPSGEAAPRRGHAPGEPAAPAARRPWRPRWRRREAAAAAVGGAVAALTSGPAHSDDGAREARQKRKWL